MITIKKVIAGLCLLFAIILVTEFSIAKGILYEQFSQLPVLQSLHADTRFTSSFILPLAIIAAKVFDVLDWKMEIWHKDIHCLCHSQRNFPCQHVVLLPYAAGYPDAFF